MNAPVPSPLSRLSITIPLRIESVGNKREHWGTKATRTAEHRRLGRVLVLAHLPRRYTEVWNGQHFRTVAKGAPRKVEPLRETIGDWTPAVVTFTRIGPAELDDDNVVIGCKAVRDGVAQALGVDDRAPLFIAKYGQYRLRFPKGTPPERKYALRIDIETTGAGYPGIILAHRVNLAELASLGNVGKHCERRCGMQGFFCGTETCPGLVL